MTRPTRARALAARSTLRPYSKLRIRRCRQGSAERCGALTMLRAVSVTVTVHPPAPAAPPSRGQDRWSGSWRRLDRDRRLGEARRAFRQILQLIMLVGGDRLQRQ